MTSMKALDGLSDDEVQQVIALAAQMHTEHHLGEPAGEASMADIAQAVSRIRARRLLRSAHTGRLLAAGLATLLLLLTIVDLTLSSYRTTPPGAPPPATMAVAGATAVTLPPPGDTALTGVAVPAGFPRRFDSYASGDATAITFVNHRRGQVLLNTIGAGNRPVPYYLLRPGEQE